MTTPRHFIAASASALLSAMSSTGTPMWNAAARVFRASFEYGAFYAGVRQLVRRLLGVIALVLLMPTFATAGADQESDNAAVARVREELWGIPSLIPMLAYMIRPVGNGPFPLLVMNHGVSLDPKERSYFPAIEFRDAALWFAKQGYVVVAPVRPGYGASAIEIPERGLFALFFSGVGNCSDANFRDAGLAIASLDMWIIDYMSTLPFIMRDNVIVVGQSGGGWARSRLPVRIRVRYGQLSASRPAAAAISTANPTIIALRIVWLKQWPSSDELHEYLCCGSMCITTAISGPIFRCDWPRPFKLPAAMSSIICCRILERTAIFLSTLLMLFVSGPPWSASS